MVDVKWNKKTYKKFIDYLYTLQDKKYKDFHFKLLKNDSIKLIGIRTNNLKLLAKQISKTNYDEFIKINTHETYEEVVIHGFILSFVKDFDKLLKLLDDFVKYIDNWATNDLVSASLKQFKKNQEKGYNYILKCLNGNDYMIRFGLTLLLNHYLNDDYIDKVLNISNNINNDNYS